MGDVCVRLREIEERLAVFLTVSYNYPHEPFHAPRDLWDLYEGADIDELTISAIAVLSRVPDLLTEMRLSGSNLQNNPFDGERHFRFADALRDVGEFGAARLHYQQAIKVCHYRQLSRMIVDDADLSKYQTAVMFFQFHCILFKHTQEGVAQIIALSSIDYHN